MLLDKDQSAALTIAIEKLLEQYCKQEVAFTVAFVSLSLQNLHVLSNMSISDSLAAMEQANEMLQFHLKFAECEPEGEA